MEKPHIDTTAVEVPADLASPALYRVDAAHHPRVDRAEMLRYLEGLGAREVTCTIDRGNAVSRAMHESCGFVKTDLPPVNPWGETEDGCLLYRFRTGA